MSSFTQLYTPTAIAITAIIVVPKNHEAIFLERGQFRRPVAGLTALDHGRDRRGDLQAEVLRSFKFNMFGNSCWQMSQVPLAGRGGTYSAPLPPARGRLAAAASFEVTGLRHIMGPGASGSLIRRPAVTVPVHPGPKALGSARPVRLRTGRAARLPPRRPTPSWSEGLGMPGTEQPPLATGLATVRVGARNRAHVRVTVTFASLSATHAGGWSHLSDLRPSVLAD